MVVHIQEVISPLGDALITLDVFVIPGLGLVVRGQEVWLRGCHGDDDCGLLTRAVLVP